MRLDLNNNPNGKGKYALIKLRNYPPIEGSSLRISVSMALDTLAKAGMLDYGDLGTESEFMVMRLKDKYALKGLQGYFDAVMQDDPVDTDYAQDILDMSRRAGPNSQWCKKPD